MQKELAQFCMAETHPIFGEANDSESRDHISLTALKVSTIFLEGHFVMISFCGYTHKKYL